MARAGRAKPKAAAPQGRTAYSIIVIAAAVAGLVWLVLATSSGSADDATCPADTECVTAHTDTGDHVFTVEWAIEPAEQTCGLMFREAMAADHGMVFDFRTDGDHTFWMRNTLISLDMIFIRGDGEVVNVAANTTPLSLASVPSTGPVRYVLEVVAGTADRIGLEPGDRFDLARRPGLTAGTAVCFPPI